MTLPFLAFGLVLFFTLLWMGEGSVLVGLLLILVAATVLFFIWGNRRSAAGKVF
jgi:Ca2+/Na+ antiporter